MPSYRTPSARDRQPLRRRAGGLALALGVNLLLLLALLQLGVIPLPGSKTSDALVVDLVAAPAPSPATAAAPSAAARPKSEPKPLAPRPRIVLPVTKPPSERPVDVLYMSKADLAAADIGNLPKRGSGAGADSQELGRAPNGEVLYAAEWAREPTAAELGGYLPKNAQEGTGLVACKTIPGNRVEDCVELESRPAGSRLASAVRQAAWQFRVRPPRKNGKELVGSWVRIRIEYYR